MRKQPSPIPIELRNQAVGRIGPDSNGVVLSHEWLHRKGIGLKDRVPVGVGPDILIVGVPGSEPRILEILAEIAGGRK